MSTKISVYNIAYNATDEQIVEFLQLVGPLKQQDGYIIKREPNSRKVYGYFTYEDAESALSAMRNLNKLDFQGRDLTIKYTEQEMSNNQSSAQGLNMNQGNSANQQQQSQQTLDINQQQNEEKLNSIIDLYEHVNNLSKSEKLFLIKEMQNLADKDRSFFGVFLQQNPKMTNMILKLQTELNMNPCHNMNTNINPNIQPPNIMIQNQIRTDNIQQKYSSFGGLKYNNTIIQDKRAGNFNYSQMPIQQQQHQQQQQQQLQGVNMQNNYNMKRGHGGKKYMNNNNNNR